MFLRAKTYFYLGRTTVLRKLRTRQLGGVLRLPVVDAGRKMDMLLIFCCTEVRRQRIFISIPELHMVRLRWVALLV